MVLDCLTQDGLLSPVNEIRYMTLSVMVDVTKHAGAAIRCVTNSILFVGTLCALLIVPSLWSVYNMQPTHRCPLDDSSGRPQRVSFPLS